MILTEDVGVHPGVSGRGAVEAAGVDSVQLRPVSILINQRPADITLKKINTLPFSSGRNFAFSFQGPSIKDVRRNFRNFGPFPPSPYLGLIHVKTKFTPTPPPSTWTSFINYPLTWHESNSPTACAQTQEPPDGHVSPYRNAQSSLDSVLIIS